MRRLIARCPVLLVVLLCAKSAALLLFRSLRGVGWFLADWRAFRSLNRSNFATEARDMIPCLSDRTETTHLDPVYFVQDTWLAGRLAERRPVRHWDVGSSAKSMALIAQFIPVTMIDIRPVPIVVPGFSFVKGSILSLPFGNGSLASLSSICVVEHIGLGRYGDVLDVMGTDKAVAELKRVLAPGGDLYLSVPVDAECRVYFNAHRALTRAYMMDLCAGLQLVAEQYLYGLDVEPQYDRNRGFGTGMYHFRKV